MIIPLLILEIIGTFAFALSGALVARHKKMDIFGMSVLAIVTASGGGMLRSTLTGDYPVAFLTNPLYIVTALVAIIVVFYGHHHTPKYQKGIILADAIGLGLFLSIGTIIGIENGYSLWASVLLGIITATFGGVLRDVLANEIPLIFQKELYATAALIGGLVLIISHVLNFPTLVSIIAGTVATLVVRLLAIRYGWSLPRPS